MRRGLGRLPPGAGAQVPCRPRRLRVRDALDRRARRRTGRRCRDGSPCAATAPAAISRRRRRCASATKAVRALCGQLLIYPVTDYHTPGTPSYRENAEGYGLTRDTMVWFWDHYLSDPSEAADPYVSPLRARDFSRLPPALVVTAEYDPLRDEGEYYAEKLRAAGTPAVTSRWDGMNHGFFFWVGRVDKAGAAMAESCQWLRQIFHGGATADAIRTLRRGAGAARRPRRRQRRRLQGLHRIRHRGRGARLSERVHRRASLHRLRPGLGDAEPAHLDRRAHAHAAARHRGDRAALAQSGAAGRTGGDGRSAVGRAAGFRHRQGLPAQRVRRLPHPDGGGRAALRGIDRHHHQGVDVERAVLVPRQVLAVRRHHRRAAHHPEAAPAVLAGRRPSGIHPPRRAARA